MLVCICQIDHLLSNRYFFLLWPRSIPNGEKQQINVLIECTVLSKCTPGLNRNQSASRRSPKIFLQFTTRYILRYGTSCNCISISGRPIRLTWRVEEGKQKLKIQKESLQKSPGNPPAVCVHMASRGRRVLSQSLNLLSLAAEQV